LTRLAPELSRARVQKLVGEGRVRLAGRPAKVSARLRGGEAIEVEIPPPEPLSPVAQDLPLRVIYEDRDLVVLDKAAGMVVHPARGAPHSTVVNALLHRFGPGEGARLGLVHRLDRLRLSSVSAGRPRPSRPLGNETADAAEDNRVGWRPGRGATTKTGNPRRAPRRQRPQA